MARHYKSLKELPTSTPAPSREIWLVFHRDGAKAPAVRAVIDYLTEIFKNDWAKF